MLASDGIGWPPSRFRHRRCKGAPAPPDPTAVPVRYTLLLLSLALAAPAPAQWTPQGPLPTVLDVRGVGAPTPDHVFIATEDDSFDTSGALFESADGGATWTQRDVPASGFSPLNGLTFLDSQHGWAFGNANVRTTDGGQTWQEMPFLGSTYSMTFATADVGVASTGDLHLSRDGGATWTVSPDGIYALAFADAQTGLGVSAQGLFRTTDAAATFATVRAGAAAAAVFLTPAVAVAISDGQLVRSADGGADVGRRRTGGRPDAPRARLRTRRAGVERRRVLPQPDGDLLRSADGGLTWTPARHRLPRRRRGVRRRGRPDGRGRRWARRPLPLGRRRRDVDADVRLARPAARLPEHGRPGLRRRTDGLRRLRSRLRRQDDGRRTDVAAAQQRHRRDPPRRRAVRRRLARRRRRRRDRAHVRRDGTMDAPPGAQPRSSLRRAVDHGGPDDRCHLGRRGRHPGAGLRHGRSRRDVDGGTRRAALALRGRPALHDRPRRLRHRGQLRRLGAVAHDGRRRDVDAHRRPRRSHRRRGRRGAERVGGQHGPPHLPHGRRRRDVEHRPTSRTRPASSRSTTSTSGMPRSATPSAPSATPPAARTAARRGPASRRPTTPTPSPTSTSSAPTSCG